MKSKKILEHSLILPFQVFLLKYLIFNLPNISQKTSAKADVFYMMNVSYFTKVSDYYQKVSSLLNIKKV